MRASSPDQVKKTQRRKMKTRLRKKRRLKRRTKKKRKTKKILNWILKDSQILTLMICRITAQKNRAMALNQAQTQDTARMAMRALEAVKTVSTQETCSKRPKESNSLAPPSNSLANQTNDLVLMTTLASRSGLRVIT